MATLRVESATKSLRFSCPPQDRLLFASRTPVFAVRLRPRQKRNRVARQTKGRRFTHARPPTMAHGSGWMHGLVKAVPSGDCVVVMGNAAQVSARVYPPARTAASRQKRVQTNNRSSARVPPPGSITARRRDPRDPRPDPISRHPSRSRTGRTSSGKDHNPRVARGSPHGARAPSRSVRDLPNPSSTKARPEADFWSSARSVLAVTRRRREP